MRNSKIIFTMLVLAVLFVGFNILKSNTGQLTEDNIPLIENVPREDIQNFEWTNEELITLRGYTGNAMEIGISPDGEYLLFNDKMAPNKDMHWATRIDDLTYQYKGKVRNTVTPVVDGTPSFDSKGNIYFTTLKTYSSDFKSIYMAKFKNGVAINPVAVEGDIYITNKNTATKKWISLDPDISDDGKFLFYSEGLFNGSFPNPFNVRGAELKGGEFKKMDDSILQNINTNNLEYAPAISKNGLELFFTRIILVNGQPSSFAIYTARRKSTSKAFGVPEKITAITGVVEAPVLSGDEKTLYYHREDDGIFKVYRVTRK